MNQQDVTGALANGGHYRATSYAVEVMDPDGRVTEGIDANDIAAVQRRGNVVTIKRKKGRDLVLEGATLDDAGRLEAAVRAATGAAGAQPAKKGGGFGRFLLIGCGGLTGVVILIVIIAAVATGGGTKKESAGSSGGGAAGEQTTGAAGAKDNVATLAEGQAATAENVKLTILQIADPFVSANQFSRPSQGNRYVAFKVQLENVGSRSVSANAFNFKLLDAENFQHQFASVVFPEQSLVGQGQELGSGAKLEGWIGFEVKDGVGLQQLVYDPNPFTKTDIVFQSP